MHSKAIVALVMWGCFIAFAHGTQPIKIKHFQSQARYAFGLHILELALSKLDTPYELEAHLAGDINEARGERLVIDGELDLEFMIATKDREKNMIAIKHPIYQGMIGLRLLLVKKEQHNAINSISSIEQLRQYVGGHGTHWRDLPIYEHNQLPVVTNVVYASLFKQLKTDRFDYFHRGISEIWNEWQQHKDTLDIADNIMLFYLQPTYFFITKQRPQLAKDIQTGLNAAIADGSYKRLFLKYVGEDIKRANLAKRKLIVLDNPILPANTKVMDMSWWLPKKHQQQIEHQLKP